MAEWTLLLEPKNEDHVVAFVDSIPNCTRCLKWVNTGHGGAFCDVRFYPASRH
jgi:hypothetical protein